MTTIQNRNRRFTLLTQITLSTLALLACSENNNDPTDGEKDKESDNQPDDNGDPTIPLKSTIYKEAYKDAPSGLTAS